MTFNPPFCPNKDCPTHHESTTSGQTWYLRKGLRPTKTIGPVPRFQCRVCLKGFSQRTFDIDYWTHRRVDYPHILSLLVGGSGLRQSCRTLGVSLRLLANRHARLARQALALHSRCMQDFSLREPVAFDGFESFAYSQYYPNNLNLLVTGTSQLVLGLNAALLRRKGRMTEAQKRRRKVLESLYRAPAGDIYRTSQELLGYGCHLAFGSRHLPFHLHTDEKKDYEWALERLPVYGAWKDAGVLVHHRTSSKAPRTLANPLFPVNYLDRQLRKDLAEHVRETVRFARRIEQSLERTVIHLVHHNYFKSFRSRKPGVFSTHAAQAGMDEGRVHELRQASLRDRAMGWREDLEDWQLKLWRRSTRVPIHPVTPLARHLMSA